MNDQVPPEWLREWANMTPAQRISTSDQASAMLNDLYPQITPTLEAGKKYLEETIELVKHDLDSALAVALMVQEVLTLLFSEQR